MSFLPTTHNKLDVSAVITKLPKQKDILFCSTNLIITADVKQFKLNFMSFILADLPHCICINFSCAS